MIVLRWMAGLARSAWRSFRQTAILLYTYAPISGSLAIALLASAFAMFLISAVGTFVPSAAPWPFIVVKSIGRLPGPAAFFLCAGLLLGPLSFLFFWIDLVKFRIPVWIPYRIVLFRLRRPPVVTLLVGLMIFTTWKVSLHNVRVVEPSKAFIAQDARSSLDDEWAAWKGACAKDVATPHPIIVAISGGASRAGLWGLRVLDEVDQDAAPSNTSIFAISSVSGGSLGAAAYESALAAQAGKTCRLDRDTSEMIGQREAAFRDALSADSLGPLLAGLLWGDVTRALLGLPEAAYRKLFGSHPAVGRSGAPIDYAIRGGDRADALEESFERNWREAFRAHPAAGQYVDFSKPFLSLFYAGPKLPRGEVPIWIANGTDDQLGGRILTAPFLFTELPPFPAAKDALGLLKADVRISTAIDNTARFPYLSPPGELAPVGTPDLRHAAQIVDGGYFENEGLQTALELARWLRKKHADPIIVQVTADADDEITEDRIPRCVKGSDPSKEFHDDPERPAGKLRPLQLMAPIEGVYTARTGHSDVALREAVAEMCAAGAQRFFHFYLYDRPKDGIPLNWVLSPSATDYIWNQEIRRDGNGTELENLQQTLAAIKSAGNASNPSP